MPMCLVKLKRSGPSHREFETTFFSHKLPVAYVILGSLHKAGYTVATVPHEITAEEETRDAVNFHFASIIAAALVEMTGYTWALEANKWIT